METTIPIIENADQWRADYRPFLDHLDKTGQTEWNLYKRVRNKMIPAAPGLDLSHSRLMFISSSGAYIKGQQEPYDAPNNYGDYTLRRIPSSIGLDQLAFAHDHYDHQYVDADPQVVVPLRHLDTLVEEEMIGELSPSWISFMGYQPDASRVVDETYPAMLDIVQDEQPDAVLLVPV